MSINPYLDFNGHCQAAIDFYTEVLGAKTLVLMRFCDAPDQSQVPPGGGDKVMHATLDIRGATVMCSDTRCQGELSFSGVSLSIPVADADEGQALFDALARGGQIEMAFGPTFWTSGFGMLRDKFGVSWMINVMEEAPS